MSKVYITGADSWGSEYKKYRSTEEHIRQNQIENEVQRQRNERARIENTREIPRADVTVERTVPGGSNRAS